MVFHIEFSDNALLLCCYQLCRLLPSKPSSDVSLTLGPFAYMYTRLSTDSSRSVRAEAATTLGQLAQAAGKALAPHLKALIGPWWVAQFDPHGEAANAARSGFQVRSQPGAHADAQGGTERHMCKAGMVDQRTATAVLLVLRNMWPDTPYFTLQPMQCRPSICISGPLLMALFP
jgi:hypothetical protein